MVNARQRVRKASRVRPTGPAGLVAPSPLLPLLLLPATSILFHSSIC
jgi:hypothetical protein